MEFTDVGVLAPQLRGRMKRTLSTTQRVKAQGVKLAADGLFRLGACDILRATVVKRSRGELGDASEVPFAVLLYHRVNPDRDPFFPSVRSDVFDAQMGYLAKHYRVLSLTKILERLARGDGVEPCTVAITFDDGYRDNFLHAHRILRRYGLPATLFVAAGYLNSNSIMWNDQLSAAFKNTKRTETTFETGDERWVLPLRSTNDRLNSLNQLIEFMKKLSEDEKKAKCDSVINELGTAESSERLMLNWDELRRMNSEGWDIGSHTINHVILTRISQAAALVELKESREMLENNLDNPVSLLAYPNGKSSDFSTEIKSMARATGYRGGMTTIEGFNRNGVDLFEVRRFSPWEEDLPSFAVKLGWRYWKESFAVLQ